MGKRILAILIARNREFYRDRAGLGWNILMPIMMVLAFAFIFRTDGRGSIQGRRGDTGRNPGQRGHRLFWDSSTSPSSRSTAPDAAITKVERHQLDLLVDLRGSPAYWVNLNSAKGYLAERLLLGAYAPPARRGAGAQDRERRGTALRRLGAARRAGDEHHVLQSLGRGLGDRALSQERGAAAAQGHAAESVGVS